MAGASYRPRNGPGRVLTLPPVRWLRKGSWPRRTARRLVAETAVVMGTITHVSTRERAAALTFDDGPHPIYTPRLLDVLAEHGARATFFVVGVAARAHPEIVRRMVDEGHAVGNHSWDHPSLPLLTRRGRKLQMAWCDEQIPDQETRLFRAPWGHQNLAVRWLAARRGYRVVTWNVMAEDWAGDPPEVLVERVEAGLAPGAVVLFHDALYETHGREYRPRDATIEAVRRLLERHDDYRFVTVPELLRLGRPRRWHWYKRSDLGWLKKQVGPDYLDREARPDRPARSPEAEP